MSHRLVFDGKHLRAALRREPGASGRLFVSFRQWLRAPGSFSEPPPARFAAAAGFSHLFLQSRLNDWYLNPETKALEACLAEIGAGFGDIRAMGFSMGGYAAMRFAPALGIGRVLLVSPQLSLDPALAPWETRYPEEAARFDARLGALAPAPGLRGQVLFDPARRPDRLHAEALAGFFPAIEPCRFGFGGHPATRVIGDAGWIGRLQAMIVGEGQSRPALLALHRKARRQSENYSRWLRQALDARARRV